MAYDISAMVQKWSLEDISGSEDYNDVHAAIEDLTEKKFSQYIPTSGPAPDFRRRLVHWLEQVKEKDQKTMFKMVPKILFIGREEFASLYRTAFREPITRWLINDSGLQFLDSNFDRSLKRAIRETWFCSITDWAIGDFYRVNGLSGTGYRPDFTSLSKFGRRRNMTKFMSEKKLKRIVLLEDFVGSGEQMLGVETLIAKLPNTIPILIVPLVVCPSGVVEGLGIQQRYSNVSFVPVLKLPKKAFVAEASSKGEPKMFSKLRRLVKRVYPLVSGGAVPDDSVKPYGPFGFARTGGVVVLYSNCPDNTLPLIQFSSSRSAWKPLFPRSSRL